MKGSPEIIAQLCDTMPSDFVKVLQQFTSKGYRVIAFGQRDIQDISEEGPLQFLGLLVMINSLKPCSTGIIQELNECNIRTIMATGDNLLTA